MNVVCALSNFTRAVFRGLPAFVRLSAQKGAKMRLGLPGAGAGAGARFPMGGWVGSIIGWL